MRRTSLTLSLLLLFAGGIWGEYSEEQMEIIQSDLPDCIENEKIWNNCFGTRYFGNGDIYQGEFKKNKAEGEGFYTWGEVISMEHMKGFFKNNKPYKGLIVYKSGAKYEGKLGFPDGILAHHGKGVLTYSDGLKISGNWKNDKISAGTAEWPQGDTYSGSFITIEKDGSKAIYRKKGTSIGIDGTKFVGSWNKNLPLEGTLTTPGRKVYKRKFVNGEYVYSSSEKVPKEIMAKAFKGLLVLGGLYLAHKGVKVPSSKSTSISGELDGFDNYLSKNYVVLEKNCFKVNGEMSMYDYKYKDYHHISIEDVECVNKGCEVEIFDWTLDKYRFIEIQKDMCPQMR